MPFRARHHSIFGLALAWALAFSGAALAQDCQLKQVASVDLLMAAHATRPMVPVAINGAPKLFLLDTGGYTTQISADAARDLKLREYDDYVKVVDVLGNITSTYVVPNTIVLGTAHKIGFGLNNEHLKLIVSPSLQNEDGLLSTDLFFRYDIEMDFGAGKLNYFLQDHCPGKVVYWNPKAVAVVPLWVQDRHIYVQVLLDGKSFLALVDTGATDSFISIDLAKVMFGVSPDSPGVGPTSLVNGKVVGYSHTFSSLAFEGVTVSNPSLVLVPESAEARRDGPHLTLGMNILRHLRMYMALKESFFYVSAAEPAAEKPLDPGQPGRLRELDEMLALSPTSASILNERCFARGIENVKLDGALADCDLSLTLRPDDADTLDNRGLALFRQGRFQAAVEDYDRTLKKQPQLVTALFIRGLARKKLGDMPGGEADITAATKLQPEILAAYKAHGITAD